MRALYIIKQLVFRFQLYTTMPKIYYKDDEKLHICKSPCCQSWMNVIGCIFCAILISSYGLESTLWRIICLVSSVILALANLETWEDCVMDKQMDRLLLTQTKWYDRLMCRLSDINTKVLPLSDVVSVTTSSKNGLQILLRSHEALTIIKYSKKTPLRNLKKLREKISSFLHLERVESIPCYPDWNMEYSLAMSEEIDEMLSTEEDDDLLQDAESRKSAHLGCRNAIKVLALYRRMREGT